MTVAVTPPRKPSHRVRNGAIAAVVVLVVLAAIGSAAGHPTSSSPPAAAGATAGTAAGAAVTSAPLAVATVAAIAQPSSPPPVAPAATTKTLLAITGNGIKTSKSFRASGDSVDVTYSFNCAAFGSQGNFQIMFYGASALGPTMPDILANALAAKGSDTTTEYLNGATGPFHVEINSECGWSVKVIGTP